MTRAHLIHDHEESGKRALEAIETTLRDCARTLFEVHDNGALSILEGELRKRRPFEEFSDFEKSELLESVEYLRQTVAEIVQAKSKADNDLLATLRPCTKECSERRAE